MSTTFPYPCPRCAHDLEAHTIGCIPKREVRDADGWIRYESDSCDCPLTFTEALANAKDRAGNAA